MSIIRRWREIELRRLAYRQGALFITTNRTPEYRRNAQKVLRLVFDGTNITEFSHAFDSASVFMDDTRYTFDGYIAT
jgi:hypothetical protein